MPLRKEHSGDILEKRGRHQDIRCGVSQAATANRQRAATAEYEFPNAITDASEALSL